MSRTAPRHSFLDHPGPIAFAHRGGTDSAPENTLAAFEAAAALGYRYLETDVHATRDGRLAAFHDPDLKRMAGKSRTIGGMTAAELARLDLDGHGVPLLDDLLEAFPEARFNIDPKTDAAAELLPAVLRRHAVLERVCVGAFSDTRLARLRRELGEGLCTSMGPGEVAKLRFTAYGLPLGNFVAEAAQLPTHWKGLVPLVDASTVTAAHARGLQVHVWTINDEAGMERLLDLGVDGIMTDRTGLLRSVMERRGLWR